MFPLRSFAGHSSDVEVSSLGAAFLNAGSFVVSLMSVSVVPYVRRQIDGSRSLAEVRFGHQGFLFCDEEDNVTLENLRCFADRTE